MMKQRITYISLVLFAVLFLAPQEQLSASSYYVERNSWEWIFDHIIREGDDSFYGGDGSKERPYRIWQGQHLAKLAYDVNVRHNSYKGKYFELLGDVNLQDYRIDGYPTMWIPIGIDQNHPFEGNFDGKGHTITGMIVKGYGESNNNFHYGLFGTSRGYIRNVHIKGGDIRISQDSYVKSLYIGMLCGYMGGNRDTNQFGAIYGCTAQGHIQGRMYEPNERGAIGGLVGFVQNPASIYRCHTDVWMEVSGCSYFGGIVGYVKHYSIEQVNWWKDTNGPLETFVFDCTSKVNSVDETTRYAGGICGYNEGGNIEACGSQGNIHTDNNGTSAGICARNKGNIIGCVSTATLQGSGYVGGIVGKNETLEFQGKWMQSTIIYCAYSGHISASGAQYVGGVAAHSAATGEINSLFLGTMDKSTVTANSHPISLDGSGRSKENSMCYFDQNLIQSQSDAGGEGKSIELLTNGQSSSLPSSSAQIASLKNLYMNRGMINVTGIGWQFTQGYYPCVSFNGANNASSGLLYDSLIERALSVWGDNTDLKTPALFPDYAWLVSVPLGFTNVNKAYDLYSPFSVAEKKADGRKAIYYRSGGSNLLLFADEMATPTDPGVVTLAVQSDKNISKDLTLQVTFGQLWDGTYADSYDGGNGSLANPFLIHNSRQFAKMLNENEEGEYYKLTQDIIFNKDLILTDGTINPNARNFPTVINDISWKAHLDGDSHLVRGLYKINCFGIFREILSGASIENVGFVDTYMEPVYGASPSAGAIQGTSSFLASKMYGNAVVRNCMFQGLVRVNPLMEHWEGTYDAHGLVGYLFHQNNAVPTIEDCVIAFYSWNNNIKANVFANVCEAGGWDDYEGAVTTVRRNLILGGAAKDYVMKDNQGNVASCYFPQGYFSHPDQEGFNRYERSMEELTNGTVFANEERWQSEQGYFPMLKSFANNDWGRLLSLPFFTDSDNALDAMKRQMELRYGAKVTLNDASILEVDEDMTAIAPLQEGRCFLTRTLERARITTPITVTSGFVPGVTFADEHARMLCETNFDSDGNHRLSLSELRKISDSQLVSAVNNSQQEAEQIIRFNEFALFRGITQLGTSEHVAGAPRRAAEGTAFHNMKSLKEFRIPESVTTIGEEAFKGCDQLETVTLTQKITSVSGKAFYHSNVKNICVDNGNPNYVSRDSMLYTKNDELVCYPNGRKATSITLSGTTRRILKDAIYKIENLDTIFLDGTNLHDVTELAKGGVVHYSQDEDATEPAMRIFVNDGSFDQRLLKNYKNDASWSLYDDNQRIDRYYPLTFNDAKAATLYLGFATQLPEELKVYLVNKDLVEDASVILLNISKKINNKLGAGTSVVVRSPKKGTYNLLPYTGTDATKIPLYLNALNGVGEEGLRVNQGDSNEGNCLTLGRNREQKLGFYYYKNELVKPFRAYLTVNTVHARTIDFEEEEPDQESEADLYDALFAYKMNDDGQSCRAVWYYGDAKNITIPATVEGIPVTGLGKNLFYGYEDPIWSVAVPSSIKTLRVARGEKNNPFFGLSDDVMIYLPEKSANYTAPEEEWNVVMGDECKLFYLADGQSFCPPRDFTADYLQYNRQLWAETDIVSNYEASDLEEMSVNHKDGTNEALARESDFDLFDIRYSRKAYTLCLPFDIDLDKVVTNDESDLKVYQLKYVKDNLHFIFVEVSKQLKAGEPYFIVVNGGGYILLSEDKTKVTTQLHPLTITDYKTGAVVGQFKGTLSYMVNDEAIADHAYIIQSTGNWHRVANKTEQQKKVYINSCRSYFSRTDGFTRNRYYTNFKTENSNARLHRAAADDDGITDFPADAYYSDIDFEVEDDATDISPIIQTIDLDGTERIYDLSGRSLNSKPSKGTYIKNGKKYINK